MSKWLALLKERKNSSSPEIEPTKPTDVGSVGFVGSPQGETGKNRAPEIRPPGASEEPTACLGCGKPGRPCEEIIPYGTGPAKWWLHPSCHRGWTSPRHAAV
jgi:hypothetical protein